MSETALEERVARLERLVDGLVEHRIRYPAPGQDWRSTVGMFDGDPIFQEMLDEVFRRVKKNGGKPATRNRVKPHDRSGHRSHFAASASRSVKRSRYANGACAADGRIAVGAATLEEQARSRIA